VGEEKVVSRRGFVAAAGSAGAMAIVQRNGGAKVFMMQEKKREERMTMMKLMPYLLFDGRCAEAMEFYQRCLGGELKMLKVKDSPAKGQMTPEQQEKVLNAQLTGGRLEVSASDWLMRGAEPVRGNTVCMYLTGGSVEELRAAFDRLAEGAEVTAPLKEVFYGVYGTLNDRFGVRWMFQANREG